MRDGSRGGLADVDVANAPLSFARNRQPKHRRLSLPRNIHPANVVGMRQVQGLAMLAPVNFGIGSPLPRNIPATLLHDIGHVIPTLQVSPAKLPSGVLFVAGTLSLFFHFHFVIGKLWRRYHVSSGQ